MFPAVYRVHHEDPAATRDHAGGPRFGAPSPAVRDADRIDTPAPRAPPGVSKPAWSERMGSRYQPEHAGSMHGSQRETRGRAREGAQVTDSANGQAHDVVILGGGSGGYAAALRAAELGLSVALVEKDKLGGTCLHRGCIPTKALLHAAEVADSARESEQFGVRATFESIDIAGVNKYKDGVVGRLYKGLQALVKSKSIAYVEGEGRLVAADTVDVGGTQYRGRHVVLGTGSYARSLPGLDIGGRIMTSDQALLLDYLPARVIVLGGGVIGVEFASVWKSFGAEVTIVEALPRLVPAEDEACSKALERAFRKRKIAFKTGVRFSGATQTDAGVTVTLESGE